MKKILIITTSHDNKCIETVSEEIKKKGGVAIRFNTDLYPSKISLSTSFKNGKWDFMMKQDGVETNLNDVHAIWYRRMNVAADLSKVIDEKYFPASKEESRRTLLGTLSVMDTFILDYQWKIRYADMKLRQLKVANMVGLEIPETLFSNDMESTREFYHGLDKNMITKMQTSFAIYEDGVENVVFTNKVSDEDLNDEETLQYCPMTFQAGIDKKVELRVTVVGKKVFAASIDPSLSKRAENDWRKEGQALVNSWKKYDLPLEIENKILRLMDYFQLNYGAIDIIVTNNNRYVFLEVNPVGEFFWLDKIEGMNISEEIANVLLNPGLRRDSRHPQQIN